MTMPFASPCPTSSPTYSESSIRTASPTSATPAHRTTRTSRTSAGDDVGGVYVAQFTAARGRIAYRAEATRAGLTDAAQGVIICEAARPDPEAT